MKHLKNESELKYERLRGVPHIRDMLSSGRRNTGSWRVDKPTIDLKKCVKCKMCWTVCPENAIKWKDGPIIDYGICKGCLLCVHECPVKAIKAERDAHRE